MTEITVVAVTCRKVAEHANAIDLTAERLPVKTRRLLISPERPVDYLGDHVPLPKIHPNGEWKLKDFNRFMVGRLPNFIDTQFALTVHWDGFAVNKENWTDEFLDYDYIGAPWPLWVQLKPFRSLWTTLRHKALSCRVGNGGFSLRSQLWMQTVQAISYAHKGEAEDMWCCKEQVRFCGLFAGIAPPKLAARFSFEHKTEWCSNPLAAFGFHGRRAMRKLNLS